MSKPTEKRKVRKTPHKKNKLISSLKRKFLGYYRQLPLQKLAAKFINRDEDTICRWKKNDKRFAGQLGMSKSEWALENTKLVKNKEWLLERIMKEEFGETVKVEHEFTKDIEEALAIQRAKLPK